MVDQEMEGRSPLNREQASQLVTAGEELDNDAYKLRRTLKDLAIFVRGLGAPRAAEQLEDAAHELNHAQGHIRQMIGGVKHTWEGGSSGETEVQESSDKSLGPGQRVEESS